MLGSCTPNAQSEAQWMQALWLSPTLVPSGPQRFLDIWLFPSLKLRTHFYIPLCFQAAPLTVGFLSVLDYLS